MKLSRRSVLISALALPSLALPSPAEAQPIAPSLSGVLDTAEQLKPLKTVAAAVNGEIIAERGYRGTKTTDPANIKSASKSVISALVGIAISKGILEGVDQPIAPLLRRELPANPDPRLERVTIGHLLSMQAGLGRMSGPNYGAWVSSPNWVKAALAAPFEDDPGGGMLYSTASTHLLSAILTRSSGNSTRELAHEWLGPQDGFAITTWDRDPQGIYLGGNQMVMSTRSLLAFGELYRNGGKARDGKQLIPADWIAQSWQPRTRSVYTGDGYGYGWFSRQIGGQTVHFGWGYGGQMIYVVPALDLTVAMTSEETEAAARSGHRDDLHAMLGQIIGLVENGARS